MHGTPSVERDLPDIEAFPELFDERLDRPIVHDVALRALQVALLLPEVVGHVVTSHSELEVVFGYLEPGCDHIWLVARLGWEYEDERGDVRRGGQVEAAQKEFIGLFGAILRLQNILTSFDEFTGNAILTDRQGQDYRSVYLDLYAEFRRDKDADKEQINDDVVFEIELIKQVEINVDYILMLVQKYRDERGDGDDKEIRAEISRAVDASPTLRNKKDLIEDFVDSLSVDGEIDQEWRAFIAAKREAELEMIITEENLRPDETRVFVERLRRLFSCGSSRTGSVER